MDVSRQGGLFLPLPIPEHFGDESSPPLALVDLLSLGDLGVLPVADPPGGAPADEQLGGLPALGAGVDDGDVRLGAPLPVDDAGAAPVGPAALPGHGLGLVVLGGRFVLGAGAGLLAEGLGRAAGSRGGGDGEEVGDDAGERRRRLRRGMAGVVEARVWAGGVAGRLGVGERILGGDEIGRAHV